MANKYIFEDSTIRRCAESITLLYKVFTTANRTLVQSQSSEFSRDSKLDMFAAPEDYFFFRFLDSTVTPVRLKHRDSSSNLGYKYLYHLEVHGFSPKSLSLFCTDDKFEIYRYIYGKFENFNECYDSFVSVVRDYLESMRLVPYGLF